MSLSLLATRLFARNVVASSKLAFRRAPGVFQIAGAARATPVGVSRVAWASSAAAAAKPKAKSSSAKRTTAKKRTTTTRRKSTAKKPAATKKTKTKKRAVKKTSVRKVAKPKRKARKKKVVKKKVSPIVPHELRPPKRPGAPFVIYCARYRQGLQPEQGEAALHFTRRVVKAAAASWQALTEQEKQPYKDEYAAAQVEYKKKFEEYVKNTDRSVLRRINKSRSKRGRSKINFHSIPTPRTGYITFIMEESARVPKEQRAQGKEHIKQTAAKWRALSDAEKATYEEKAKAVNAALKAEGA